MCPSWSKTGRRRWLSPPRIDKSNTIGGGTKFGNKSNNNKKKNNKNNRSKGRNNKNNNRKPAPKKPAAPKNFSGSIEQQRQQMLRFHNEIRTKAKLETLALNDKLNRAAQDYADYLTLTGKFSHTAKGTVATRVKETGYDFAACGENIAKACGTLGNAVKGWLAGFESKRRIFSRTCRDIGIGVSGNVVVVVYGAPKSFDSFSDSGT